MSFGGYKHQENRFFPLFLRMQRSVFAGNNYKLRASQYQYSMLCLLISLFFQTAIKRNVCRMRGGSKQEVTTVS